jgi:hypothetical protein
MSSTIKPLAIFAVAALTVPGCTKQAETEKVQASAASSGYVGCFTDDSSRALPRMLMTGGATVESCIAAAQAQGLAYAGVQYGGQCFGGDTLGFAEVADSSCNMPCTADSAETCGGVWLNSVYTANAQGLSITTTSLTSGNVGVMYSATLAATGGVSPYSWSVSTGSLPAGLALNASTGAISGTPTAGGTANLTVTVTDSASAMASQALSLTINAAGACNGIDATTISGVDNMGNNDNGGPLQAWTNTYGPQDGNGAPVTLCFPAGTYLFTSAVTFRGPVSLQGAGPGQTIFNDKLGMNTIGHWASFQYTFECAPGKPPCTNYPVNPASAAYGSSALDLGSNAASVPSDQWVFLRGAAFFPNDEYHGELNQVLSVSGNMVNLRWPLRSDFTNPADAPLLQLNMVNSADLIQNVSISGFTFTSRTGYSIMVAASQVYNYSFTNNTMDGPTAYGFFPTQWNQERAMTIQNNTFIGQVILDPSRNPTDIVIDHNTFTGGASIGASEAAANTQITNNTIKLAVDGEVGAEGYHTLVQNNTIDGTFSTPGSGIAAVGAGNGQGWVGMEGDFQILNNTITVHGGPAFGVAMPNTAIDNNTIMEDSNYPAGDYGNYFWWQPTSYSNNTVTSCGGAGQPPC